MYPHQLEVGVDGGMGDRGRRKRRLPTVTIACIAAVFCMVTAMAALSGRAGWPGGPLATASTWAKASQAVVGDPVSMTGGLFVDPESQPASWVRDHPYDPQRAMIENGIADRPLARWLVGAGDDRTTARTYLRRAAAVDRLPVLVAYNIPWRDCGGRSAGGAATPAAYRAWIRGLVDEVGTRPAVVILEPDALAGHTCLPPDQQRVYLSMLRYAVDQFADRAPNTWVYLDAGHSGWMDSGTMADRLREVHVERARGFALNISNYQSAWANVEFGRSVARDLARAGVDSKFIIDTGRSGRDEATTEWCNPAGQRTGEPPGLGRVTGLDLALWVKVPGESDGDSCGIAPASRAGQFMPSLAEALLTGTDPPPGEMGGGPSESVPVRDVLAEWNCPFRCAGR